jgi:hypothetical protein
MPEIDAIYEYGDLSDVPLKDEPDMLIQSLTITPSREKQSWKGANLAIRALRYTNPILTFAFTAIIVDPTGLCNQHPGTQVTSLLNYVGNVYQFDPNQGILVYEDPSREMSLENPAECQFSVVQYPFVGVAGNTMIPDPEPV